MCTHKAALTIAVLPGVLGMCGEENTGNVGCLYLQKSVVHVEFTCLLSSL